MSGHGIKKNVLFFDLENGRKVEAPLEIWILSLVQCLSGPEKEKVMQHVDQMMTQLRSASPILKPGFGLVNKVVGRS